MRGMTSEPINPDSDAPPRTRPEPAPAHPVAPLHPTAGARRGGGMLAVALLLALAALAGSGYVAWQQWQQQRQARVDSQTLNQVQGQLATLGAERAEQRQRLADAIQQERSLRDEVQGLALRSRALEGAVAKLSEQTLSTHDAMLLDEAESLLRMGQQRYQLFHEAAGAASALALADQALAALNDNTYAEVRQTLKAERAALSKSQPVGVQTALATLSGLRDALPRLPLKPLDRPADAGAPGVWARIQAALAGMISVRRDNGAPLAVADARFARELVALELAQAQAALLAHDGVTYAAALARAQAGLSAQFDTNATPVAEAAAQLTVLASQSPQDAVPLGAALAQLRNLRSVRALVPSAPAAPSTGPAAATSSAVRP
jgi:uroporphyrin-3 C-methyltransferase